MGLIAAAWIIALLMVGGIALDRTITAEVERSFDKQLENILKAMVANAEIDAQGDIKFYRRLGDQRFLSPNSGLYWQISANGAEDFASYSLVADNSQSLWDATLTLRGPADGADADPDPQFYDSDQFEGEPLRIAERTLILPGSEKRWTFAVASARDDLEAQTSRIRSILIWSFVVLAFGLIVLALLQVRYGLSPLRRVRAAIQDLRSTGENRITEPLPTEVQPMVDELNALLAHSEKQAEEARTHAGNLAHALKTPLTVLTNAATARDPDIATAVFRETRTMQRHVDHHLARARAVGRRAVGHARTNVRDSAEAVRRAVERLYPSGRLDIAGNKQAIVAIERQDLDEILGNLIENAAKYGGGSVFVTVDAEPDAKACEIWIEDDGAGIPEEERMRIFDRGARLDTDKPGTGLGLAIVRDVAEIYGGSVTLGESEDLGGLMVVLTLPRA
ncbi:MAG: HAMP domain-containing sensor histidine kinase [Pseudomonadota bacterium]